MKLLSPSIRVLFASVLVFAGSCLSWYQQHPGMSLTPMTRLFSTDYTIHLVLPTIWRTGWIPQHALPRVVMNT